MTTPPEPATPLRVYVAGPYTANPEACTATAIKAGDRLLDAGHAPFVPHVLHYWHTLHTERHYEDWMRLDLTWLRAADAVLRLPGESPGADQEVALAQELGIPVVDSVEGVAGAVRSARSDIGTEFVRQADSPDWGAIENVHPTSEPYAYQPPPSVTWAQSVASHGVGPTATVDIDVHMPGHDEPVPVEIPLAKARELYAHLGGILAEHATLGAGRLRERIVAALRAAAHSCDGTCGLDETACHQAHPVQEAATTHGVISDLYGPIPAIAEVVMGAIQPELDRLDAEQERYEEETIGRFNQQATNLARRAGEAEVALAQLRPDLEQTRETSRRLSLDCHQAQETNRRLNRRAQQAEAALAGVRAIGYANGQDDGWDRALNAVHAALDKEHTP